MLAVNPPPIGVNGVTFCLLADPLASATFRFGNITANPELFEIHHGFITVVALVGHDFRQPIFGNLFGGLGCLGQLSICSATATKVSWIVVVSPALASCKVTARTAPVSISTACSALCAKCVWPSFIFVILASGSSGCSHSSLEPFFGRFRSNFARSSRVGVSIPLAFAKFVKYSV